ncbi:hypothetical protein K2173_015263 [Erythroxylum novogranatense]|uniref:Pentatricopeptide repeat-containing protein n=1 Tax=Erythroxylum novogranatense TaxID=1862640 RepID=A0AAV8T1F3_9ROSI|nr:hypothetical protein K2173_015263 [Erythroxylum novogranatense]
MEVTMFDGYGIGPIAGGGASSVEDVWLVKVVSTFFATSRSKDSCLGYLRDKLTPLIAFEVIKRYNNPILGLEFLQFSRLNLNLSHCFWTYSLLLRSLCQMGLHDLATETYDYMKSDGHSFDSALLGFLVTSYAQVFKFDTVKKFISEVEREDSGINSFVYNNLLNELVKRNRVHEAIGLLKDHLAPQSPPDTWTFNILIRGLCRLGEADKAFEIFDNMGSFGCFPDIVTYNTLINGLCKANDVVRGCDLLMEVKSRDSCSPDVVTYTSIISGFCKLGQMQEASVLFEEMIVSGINPNVITFNVLIDGFGKSGNMVAAKSMYEKMISFNCRPDVVTFTSLIDGYCGTGEVSLGLKLWDVMKT